jgi:hypothetical protein
MPKTLIPRYEVHDFRDPEQRQGVQSWDERSSNPGVWDHIRKGFGTVTATLFVALTAYHLFIIGGWISDWYARQRAERGRPWKRSHVRQWNEEALVEAEQYAGW